MDNTTRRQIAEFNQRFYSKGFYLVPHTLFDTYRYREQGRWKYFKEGHFRVVLFNSKNKAVWIGTIESIVSFAELHTEIKPKLLPKKDYANIRGTITAMSRYAPPKNVIMPNSDLKEITNGMYGYVFQLVDLLKNRDKKAWNGLPVQARKFVRLKRFMELKTGDIPLDFTGFDFSEMNLSGVDFCGAILNECLFEKSDCSGCNFNSCQLLDAIFSGTNLEGATFDNARVGMNSYAGFTDFRKANMKGVKFGNLKGNFSKVILDKEHIGVFTVNSIEADGKKYSQNGYTPSENRHTPPMPQRMIINFLIRRAAKQHIQHPDFEWESFCSIIRTHRRFKTDAIDPVLQYDGLIEYVSNWEFREDTNSSSQRYSGSGSKSYYDTRPYHSGRLGRIYNNLSNMDG